MLAEAAAIALNLLTMEGLQTLARKTPAGGVLS